MLSDIDESRVDLVNRGRLPFAEPGAAEKLEQAIASRRLLASTDNAVVGQAEHVVVVIGTPVDEHLNPDPNSIPETLGRCGDHLVDGQILVLRSTVYPSPALPKPTATTSHPSFAALFIASIIGPVGRVSITRYSQAEWCEVEAQPVKRTKDNTATNVSRVFIVW